MSIVTLRCTEEGALAPGRAGGEESRFFLPGMSKVSFELFLCPLVFRFAPPSVSRPEFCG